MHPVVEDVSKKAMKAGLYADAVERAFKAINGRVKKMVKGRGSIKTDGVQLMQKVFLPETPLIRLADSADPSEQDVQRGYMYMFTGECQQFEIRKPMIILKLIRTMLCRSFTLPAC